MSRAPYAALLEVLVEHAGAEVSVAELAAATGLDR